MLAVQVQFLVRELRSHMSWGQKTKIWDRKNIVINSVKAFMWSTSKMSFKKLLGFPAGLMVKNPSTNSGDTGLILGLGRSHMPRGNWACVPQLPSLCSRAWEPQLLSHLQQLLKAACPRACAPKQEKPLQWEAHVLKRRVAPTGCN